MPTKVSMKTKSNGKQKSKRAKETETVDHDEAMLVLGGEESSVPALLAKPLAFGVVEGELETSDIKLPRLELVHGVGELSKAFNPGDIIYNSGIKLASKGEPIYMSVLAIRKFFRESLPYDPDREVRSRVFGTMEEVQEAGLSVSWGRDGSKPEVDKVAEIRVAIECPEGVDSDLFPLEHTDSEGATRNFGVAIWYVTRTSYGPVAKQIYSAAAMMLRSCLASGRWRLVTVREEKNGNVITLPVFRFEKRYPADVVEFFEKEINWNQQ